jgi:hypothetical protein
MLAPERDSHAGGGCCPEDAADLGEAEKNNREGRLGDMAGIPFEKSGHLSCFRDPSLFSSVLFAVSFRGLSSPSSHDQLHAEPTSRCLPDSP